MNVLRPEVHRGLRDCCRYLVAGLFLAGMVAVAQGKDDGRYANSPLKSWFESQHNSVGQWCCNEADGHAFYGDYEIKQDGSVIADGHPIEAYKVLKGDNPTGHAVWWFTENGYGRTTYCFAPGPLT